MKLIFLDIDGVLNSDEYYLSNRYIETQDLSCDIDIYKICILNEIIRQTSAKIIISSTWRINHYEELIQILKDKGFIGEIIGKTDRGKEGTVRGCEILSWIKDHPLETTNFYADYKNYIIIDDDSDMLLWQKDNFIHTSYKYGLMNKHISQAVKILNQE